MGSRSRRGQSLVRSQPLSHAETHIVVMSRGQTKIGFVDRASGTTTRKEQTLRIESQTKADSYRSEFNCIQWSVMVMVFLAFGRWLVALTLCHADNNSKMRSGRCPSCSVFSQQERLRPRNSCRSATLPRPLHHLQEKSPPPRCRRHSVRAAWHHPPLRTNISIAAQMIQSAGKYVRMPLPMMVRSSLLPNSWIVIS